MKPRNALLGLAVAVATALAATSALAGSPSSAPGKVKGKIVYSGGPYPGDSPAAQGGTVKFSAHGAKTRSVAVRDHHHFQVRLAAGTYRVTAVSGDALCSPSKIRVRHKKTTTIRVVCSVK
jgi:hypothetical protein